MGSHERHIGDHDRMIDRYLGGREGLTNEGEGHKFGKRGIFGEVFTKLFEKLGKGN